MVRATALPNDRSGLLKGKVSLKACPPTRGGLLKFIVKYKCIASEELKFPRN